MRRIGLILISFLFAVEVDAQPAFQVKDINPTRPRGLNTQTQEDFATLGSMLFFAHDDGGTGRELWKLDTITGAASVVKDICPGSCASFPTQLTAWNGALYFQATDGVHGGELWKSDGTAAGTFMIRDVKPGPLSNPAVFMKVVNGTLYFVGDDGVHGAEIWATDGTAAGTRLFVDVRPGPSSSRAQILAASGGRFFLAAFDDAHGVEPWVTDGTLAGTRMLADVFPGPGSGLVSGFGGEASLLPDGSFLFGARSSSGGLGLWRSDGTEAGTTLIKAINAGSQDSPPSDFTPFNGKVYFRATTPEQGRQLWVTDGTANGTVLFHDGGKGSTVDLVTVVHGQLYFRATNGLWTSDGTPAGTVRLSTFPPSSIGPLGGSVAFLSGTQTQIWVMKTDGTAAGTVDVKVLPGQTGCHIFTEPSQEVDGIFHFFSCPTNRTIKELWKSDGSTAGTVQVPIPLRTPAFPANLLNPLIPLGSHLLFTADDGFGAQLWRTDATLDGTQPVPGFVTGTWPSSSIFGSLALGDGVIHSTASELVKIRGNGTAETLLASPRSLLGRAGDLAFLGRTDPTVGAELWKTDGTAAGTSFVKNISTTTDALQQLGSLGSQFLFLGGSSTTGRELWRSDGTDAGTFVLKTLAPGTSISLFASVGNRSFFYYQGGLWKTDGTPAGTVLVKTLDLLALSRFTAVGNRLVFRGEDAAHGAELWSSDGTDAGTRLVKDIWPGAQSSLNDTFLKATAAGGQLLFVADNGVQGQELWSSDGTEAGTRLVKDLTPGAASTLIQDLATVGNVAVFSAFDGVHGAEPWRSDGTAAGTWMVQDILPGSGSSGPLRFAANDRHVYFIADNGTSGADLWAFPRKALSPTFTDVPSTYWAWKFIEALASASITTGCAPGMYCPVSQVSRAEMAVFIGRGLHGGSFTPPPATGTLFTDVPASYWAAAWIEQFAADGITTGCAPGKYCPDALVSRAEMAIFLLRAKHGAAYAPPSATGTMFTDVPASYWAASWIEQLAAEGITTGCAPGLYCPDSSVSRDQMAAFLTRTFNLMTP